MTNPDGVSVCPDCASSQRTIALVKAWMDQATAFLKSRDRFSVESESLRDIEARGQLRLFDR